MPKEAETTHGKRGRNGKLSEVGRKIFMSFLFIWFGEKCGVLLCVDGRKHGHKIKDVGICKASLVHSKETSQAGTNLKAPWMPGQKGVWTQRE